MKPATYYLETFGCQMNVLDSQLVEGQLHDLGLRPVTSSAQADVILFNTCSVRQHAEDKVLSRLGRLKHLKRRRQQVVIGVLGCMAERQREGLFRRAPHVDLICGPGELHRLPALLEQAAAQRQRVAAVSAPRARRNAVLRRGLDQDGIELLDMSRRTIRRGAALQSYVRVQRGCDKFCTYCVVPLVRGPECSRPPANIVAEVTALAQRGCREVTLLGQTVNSYAYSEDGRQVRLARLLERVHAVEGIDRFRFVTSYPADWDEDIFRVMRDCPRICPYLHLPAQSGSDRILKAMKRGYRVADYLRLVDLARKYVPDIALAGDFIVGFCGETDADFKGTVDLLQRVQYKSLFVFKYSPRPGTVAARVLADDVPGEVKIRRNNELLAIQNEISLKHRQGLVGRTVAVLVEGSSKVAGRVRTAGEPAPVGSLDATCGPRSGVRQLTGRTPHDLIAVFDGDDAHVGAIVSVRVESASALTLFGRIESVLSPPRGPGLVGT